VLEIVDTASGDLRPKRQIWFDRLNLHVVRQLIFDASGDILTDARYRDWRVYDNHLFPQTVEIIRPKDEYGVVITVVKLEMNKPLDDSKFALDRPEGTELKMLGGAPKNEARNGTDAQR
jgi:hypothetical protein